MGKSTIRVATFIDHSNVWHRLSDMRKIDPEWEQWYDPLKLSNKLAGNRELDSVNFYCAPPPPYLLNEGTVGKNKYDNQMKYYEAIRKMDNVNLKLATLKGSKGYIREKNLDTQLTTDLIMKSAGNQFDVAIIASNDGDFVPAMESAKELGRGIELLYFRNTRSMDLVQKADIARSARKSFFEKLQFDFKK